MKREGFNPRPRAAGDGILVATHGGSSPRFNPRPRAAGDHMFVIQWRGKVRGFNPRPRAAGDVECVGGRDLIFVSIHARARRATRAPADRAASKRRFNPRPRAAGDHMFVSQRRGKVRVSIHARARRATTASSPASTDAMFQSTPARGGRPASVLLADPFFGSFNPRPRAAGDRPPPSDCGHDSSFNPRPRAAGDYTAQYHIPIV